MAGVQGFSCGGFNSGGIASGMRRGSAFGGWRRTWRSSVVGVGRIGLICVRVRLSRSDGGRLRACGLRSGVLCALCRLFGPQRCRIGSRHLFGKVRITAAAAEQQSRSQQRRPRLRAARAYELPRYGHANTPRAPGKVDAAAASYKGKRLPETNHERHFVKLSMSYSSAAQLSDPAILPHCRAAVYPR